MRFILSILFSTCCTLTAFCQILETLDLSSTVQFKRIEGDFIKKNGTQNGSINECFEFINDANIELCYFPVQSDVDCGYFIIKKQKFGGELYNSKLACDLDYGSFEVFQLNMKSSGKFLLINSIGNVSGTATRRVFSNLFKITETGLVYFPLMSIYGSANNFGDFNNDGILDYIEVTYDKFDPNFKAIFTTISDDKFVKDETKFIRFSKVEKNNKWTAKIIEKKWW
jgi:hypothetical protein